MDLQATFLKASEEVNNLSQRPDNDELLRLYALYKQATIGDNNGDRPDGFDFKGAAKFDAWDSLKGRNFEDCMHEYIDLVKELQVKYGS